MDDKTILYNVVDELRKMSARPHQDIDRGWAWVAVISVYLSTIINCIAVFMGGVIHVALLNKFKEGDGKTSLVGALSSGILCMFCKYMYYRT